MPTTFDSNICSKRMPDNQGKNKRRAFGIQTRTQTSIDKILYTQQVVLRAAHPNFNTLSIYAVRLPATSKVIPVVAVKHKRMVAHAALQWWGSCLTESYLTSAKPTRAGGVVVRGAFIRLLMTLASKNKRLLSNDYWYYCGIPQAQTDFLCSGRV